MATATQSAGKKTAKSKSSAAKKTTTRKTAQKDAVALLKADHREVEGWFSQFEKASSEAKKAELVQKILLALKVHTQLEEELVYPASREVVKDEELVDEAIVEHDAAKKLMAEIEEMEPSDEMYDAKVKVLSEQIEHHVEEEEKEYFPQLQKSDMDLKAIGEQIMMRKKELMAELSPMQPKTVQ
ncbi:hemerythrin domain-containing protein [Phenylobacterium terrae]|uniref:Hemerythrin domain-containing protein n=1 Tax=Phenylobacterium terrae TaxID=2665495 RepID=A0ABW4MXW8_9CAUL